MKAVILVAVFFPALAFSIAGVTELRSSRAGKEKLCSLIPIVLGIVVFGFSLNPQWLLPLTPNSSVTLSRVMTMLSAMLACSGVFVTYSRQSTAVWVASGGLFLALFWMFNRILV